MMRRSLWILMLLCWAPGLGAQPAGAGASDHELIQQLLKRVQELEGEVRQLRASSPAAPPVVVAAVPALAPSPAAAPATSPSAPAQAPSKAAQDMMHDMSMPGTQGIQFRGFSDARYVASDTPGVHNSFALGQFNLFLTSKLSDKFSVLAEIVMEAGSENGIGVDLERMMVQYSPSDYFKVAAGRYHTAIGFYNTAYHHSTWLQTTVDRPFLFAFEDGGGVLPVHNVGLSASGRIPSGSLGLHYVAEIGNGRTSRSPLDEAVQNVLDENNGKAVNLAVFARPEAVRGFQTGFSLYRDTLHPQGLPRTGQTIYAGHVVYQGLKLESLNEVVVMRHAMQGGGVVHIPAFYSQISAPFGKVRPYFRYEYMNVPRRDPMFGDVGLRHGPLAGLRFDFSDFAAFKLEYGRILQRQTNAINALRTQVSFTF
jgi:hypothetical protein